MAITVTFVNDYKKILNKILKFKNIYKIENVNLKCILFKNIFYTFLYVYSNLYIIYLKQINIKILVKYNKKYKI